MPASACTGSRACACLHVHACSRRRTAAVAEKFSSREGVAAVIRPSRALAQVPLPSDYTWYTL
eukprot:826608-Pleurochrysis_carterae.AAC.3